jgi:hypothetical protein
MTWSFCTSWHLQELQQSPHLFSKPPQSYSPSSTLDSIPLISVPTPLDCEDLIILQEFEMLVEAAMVSNLERVTPLTIP